MSGTNIVGVQFRRAGRIYDFLAGSLNLHVGDDVVVDTDRGPSLAKVAVIRYEPDGGKDREHKDLKPINRVASTRDLDEARKLTPEEAVKFARGKVERLGLKMMILQCEVQFGGNKVILYFSAPGRVDFRELVKDLAAGLKARVELKQVGSRDEAKLVGGLGVCGREFCCSSFLRDFVPVSIKMAKNQNLALNPSKVSGGCGRLLCCLTYENDLYTELRKSLPPRNAQVRVLEENAVGRIVKGDLLNQTVVVETAEGRQYTAKVDAIEIVEAAKAAPPAETEGEGEAWGDNIDFAELARLEDEDRRGGGGRESGGGEARGTREPGGEGGGGPRGGRDGQGRGQDQNRGGQRHRRDRDRGGGGGDRGGGGGGGGRPD